MKKRLLVVLLSMFLNLLGTTPSFGIIALMQEAKIQEYEKQYAQIKGHSQEAMNERIAVIKQLTVLFDKTANHQKIIPYLEDIANHLKNKYGNNVNSTPLIFEFYRLIDNGHDATIQLTDRLPYILLRVNEYQSDKGLPQFVIFRKEDQSIARWSKERRHPIAVVGPPPPPPPPFIVAIDFDTLQKILVTSKAADFYQQVSDMQVDHRTLRRCNGRNCGKPKKGADIYLAYDWCDSLQAFILRGLCP